ncbi:MAG: signal recognition particle-docking protein FtsY [Desulfobacterales bacterium]|nr:signal recognition particle-docking protein FtsY [Desulfobacterales bacterium]
MLSWFKKKLGKKKEDEPALVAEPAAEEAVSREDAAEEPAGPEPISEPTPVPESEAVAESAPEPEPVVEPEPVPGKGVFQRLRERLGRTRGSLIARMDHLFLGRRQIDQELFDELEEILITSDLGVGTTMDLLDHVRNQVKRDQLTDPRALRQALQERLLYYLRRTGQNSELVMPESGPFVIMVVGVNGVGKTTTIGKLTHKFVQSGQAVLLVAGDTFRAAASEQLKIWGERSKVKVVARQDGVDPSSVVYDALDYARTRDFDVIIIDTAGRLHTKVNLMEELKKIKRVMDKKIKGAPHEVLLVLDATTGQNSISQARLFDETVGVTGIVLTKLDGTAKGGIVVNISHEFDIPIRFIGIGEQLEDLRDFEPEEFVSALFAGNHNGKQLETARIGAAGD